ncbi:MAG: SDR family oxidoreductase [Desulfuromonadales bacterium]|nr:SDR family oxidoreductase [Desulfuromonadales bacterium]MDW7757919.1 SDR family oxidoreductase [Desulfuromonadales bacterium]
MQIQGKTAFVSGANGGIGEALVRELLKRGAAKIYAAVRRVESAKALTQLDAEKVVPVQLDITDEASIAAAAAHCPDIDLLFNNAGCNRVTSLMSPEALQAARLEMGINYFGTLAMCQAFAPLLKARGGGLIANVCSIIGLVNLPANGTYCASKAAVHSMIQGIRAELSPQNIQVIGIYPGPVDTAMTAGQDMPKATSQEVAFTICNGVEAGDEYIFPDPMSKEVSAMLAKDPKGVEKQFATYLP